MPSKFFSILPFLRDTDTEKQIYLKLDLVSKHKSQTSHVFRILNFALSLGQNSTDMKQSISFSTTNNGYFKSENGYLKSEELLFEIREQLFEIREQLFEIREHLFENEDSLKKYSLILNNRSQISNNHSKILNNHFVGQSMCVRCTPVNMRQHIFWRISRINCQLGRQIMVP